MRINHNIVALNTHRQLNTAAAGQSKSMEKLASGLRINRAGDETGNSFFRTAVAICCPLVKERCVFMDIALMSITLSQGQVQKQASMSVMKMAMGNAEQQGEAIQKLMSTNEIVRIQHAAQPHLGGNIDLKV
ncbi:YjfB family protein [Pseudoneobacillus sp. C159]